MIGFLAGREDKGFEFDKMAISLTDVIISGRGIFCFCYGRWIGRIGIYFYVENQDKQY